MNYEVKERVQKNWEEEDFHIYFVRNTNQLFTVCVKAKKKERWFYVSVALNGIIKNVSIIKKMNLKNDLFVNTVKFSMSLKEKQFKKSRVDVQMLISTKSNFHSNLV